jgi:hypothetical protein
MDIPDSMEELDREPTPVRRVLCFAGSALLWVLGAGGYWLGRLLITWFASPPGRNPRMHSPVAAWKTGEVYRAYADSDFTGGTNV